MRRLSILYAMVAAMPGFGEAADRPELGQIIDHYNQLDDSHWPLPRPDAKELAAISNGEVVSKRQQIEIDTGDSAYRVVGYVLVPTSRLRVWIATLSSSTEHSESMIEIPLGIDASGGASWYQYLDLPWPAVDRQWLIQTGKRLSLAEQSGGLLWEHQWDLQADGQTLSRSLGALGKLPGVSEKQLRKAVYVPANTGGWVMAAADENSTLVIVHATAELGGRLPDALVARFVNRQFRRVLSRLEGRAQQAEESLLESSVLFTGNGKRITPDMLSRTQGLASKD
ncbi:MAG: hypothetical protein AAF385_11180 [Pseudomonadota bacterium]